MKKNNQNRRFRDGTKKDSRPDISWVWSLETGKQMGLRSIGRKEMRWGLSKAVVEGEASSDPMVRGLN